MRRTILVTLTILFALVVARPAAAGIISKTYEFNAGAILEIGMPTDDGLRLESVRFQMPTTTGVRTSSEATIEVIVSNGSDRGKRVGIGVALFDAQGRLVGVASGGTRLVGLKAGRNKSYKLVFADLNVEAPRATTFQISLETKP
jgi:hypothetical protein